MQYTIVQLFRTALMIFGALFPIVNPLENIPIFLTLTYGFPSDIRAVLARKVAVNGFVLLVVATLVGTHILAFFGISLAVVQVGGGCVVIATGWNLLRKDEDDSHPVAPKSLKPSFLSQRAFYPLTLPLTVGPGSISVAIAVGANRPNGSQLGWYLPIAVVGGCAAIAISIYLSYRFAESIGRVLGETAMNVIIRLSSFILVCIGVQIFWNGASTLLHSVLAPK